MHELFSAREEIQHLQGVAKLLTLSTDAFTTTRLRLSECWDSIKTVLTERKKNAQSKKRRSKSIKMSSSQRSTRSQDGIEGKGSHAAVRPIVYCSRSVRKCESVPLGSPGRASLVRELLSRKSKGFSGGAEEKKAPLLCRNKAAGGEGWLARPKSSPELPTDVAALEAALKTLTLEAAEENISKSERLELDHALLRRARNDRALARGSHRAYPHGRRDCRRTLQARRDEERCPMPSSRYGEKPAEAADATSLRPFGIRS